jgi:hypothetical protein
MCFVFEWRTRFLATLIALVMSQNKGTRLNSNPKSLSSYHPKQLGATSNSNNILSFCGGLGDARLLARRPRHKRRSKELTSPRSGLPLNMTTSIIHIRILVKRKR